MSKALKPKKSLGQNFLIDPEALTDIASAIEVHGKHIIEVGPGYGALTDYLLSQHPTTLDLVELDEDMVEILDERFVMQSPTPHVSMRMSQGQKNQSHANTEVSQDSASLTPITLHHTDVLTFTPPYDVYSVIANIPYYITSPILFRFLYDIPHPPSEMVIMMQEEVGEKILSGRKKKPHHSYLSLAMELACEDIEIVRYVGKESFDPAPKVDSIVIQFIGKKERNITQEEKLLTLWRVAFTHPRKTLLSNLKGSQYDIERVKSWLTECGYDEKVRAEGVKLADWRKLC